MSTAERVDVTSPGTGEPEPAWNVALLFPRQGLWSEADYLSLNTNHLVELSGGVLEVPEMPTDRHQAMVAFLFSRLLAFVAARELGTVRFAPLPVRLWPGKLREPDVLFMAIEHVERIGDAYWSGADLVMEVVSPGTRSLDLVTKVREYAASGIPEYWTIDPETTTVSIRVLDGEAYAVRSSAGSGGRVASVTLAGFGLDVDEILAAR